MTINSMPELGRAPGMLASVPLIDPGNLDSLIGCLGKLGDVVTIVLRGWTHMQCQQVLERVDSSVHLRSIALLRAVLPGSFATLRG